MPDDRAVGSRAPGHYGRRAPSLVTLQEVTIAAAWNLRGDPGNARFVDQVHASLDMALPAPGTILDGSALVAPALSSLWLGPSSWLVLAGGDTGASLPSTHPLSDFTATRDALAAAGGALFDVSSSRVGWTIAGPCAESVLNSGCPLDFHPRAFPVGACAQSVYGRVNALFARRGGSRYALLVARSFAHDVWSALCTASAQHGYDVRAPEAYR